MALLGTGTLRIDQGGSSKSFSVSGRVPAGGRRHRDRPQRERHGGVS
jgi:hypothetical protein